MADPFHRSHSEVAPFTHIHRSSDESKLSMHVKDSMREHSIADIAEAW